MDNINDFTEPVTRKGRRKYIEIIWTVIARTAIIADRKEVTLRSPSIFRAASRISMHRSLGTGSYPATLINSLIFSMSESSKT